jgi:hypothetical protein
MMNQTVKESVKLAQTLTQISNKIFKRNFGIMLSHIPWHHAEKE